MIEHEQLQKYATDEDDCLVSFNLCKNNVEIDWKEHSPDEILYVPENLFNNLCAAFVKKVGLEYYDTVEITNELEEILHRSFISAGNNEANIVSAREISQFIEKAKCLKETHYLTFEGP